MSLNVLTEGEGPPILLLHGFSGTARTWAAQIEALSPHHLVIAPDLLGHGESDAPTEPARYALEHQADDLADLLALLEASAVTVVGYSMGARLALVLALEHADLVARLVVESPSAGIADSVERTRRRDADEHLAADLERDGTAAFVDRWEALPLFANQASLPAERRQRLHMERLRHDAAALAASLRGAGQGVMAPLHDRLREITVATLVIAGGLDPVGLARASVVADGIPGARLAVVPDVGHAPHIEDPDAYRRLIDQFLHQSSSQ